MESLHAFLTAQADACKIRASALAEDDRRDEAVFEKIRGNVFEIFSAVCDAAAKQPQPMAFFRSRLSSIPASWEAAYEKATAHGDDKRAHTELVKLEAVRVIRERLEGAA